MLLSPHVACTEVLGHPGRFAVVGGKAIKIEPGTQLNTITTYPTSTIPITKTNIKAIPTAQLTNKPTIAQLQPQPSLAQPMGAFNIRITKDLLAGPNRTQQQTSAWISNNTGIILSPSLTIRQIGEVRTVPVTTATTTTTHQIPTTATITQPAYLVPQVWRTAPFKSTAKANIMPALISKKRTGPMNTVTFPVPAVPTTVPIERNEANDLEQFTASTDNFGSSDEEDSDAERMLGHSDDNMYDDDMEEDGDDGHVQVDDDYKPPYRVKVMNRDQLNRQCSSSGSANDSKREDRENSKDIKYVEGNDKPWVCKNCNRNYKWKNSLKCHLKNECGLPPKYFCSRDCGYKTNVHSNLKRHLNSKFCKSRDPPTEGGEEPAEESAVEISADALLATIKEEPVD